MIELVDGQSERLDAFRFFFETHTSIYSIDAMYPVSCNRIILDVLRTFNKCRDLEALELALKFNPYNYTTER